MLEKGASKHRGAAGDVKNCGNVTFIGADELHTMGYDRVNADIHSHYRFDPASGDLHMYFELMGHDIGDLSMNGVFATDARRLSAAEMMGAKPMLKSATIRYADLSYNKRNSEFCAHREGISVDTYIDRSVADAADQARQAGLAPQQTTDRRLSPVPCRLRDADGEAGPAHAGRHQYASLLYAQRHRLPTRSPVGYQRPTRGQPSVSLGQRGHPAPSTQPGGTSASAPKQSSASKAPAADAGSSREAAKPRLKTIRVAELEGHLGESARIRIKSGREYVGVLEAKRGDKLMLKRQLRGGYMTFPVPLDDLDTITLLNR